MFQCTQTPLNFRAFFGLVVFLVHMKRSQATLVDLWDRTPSVSRTLSVARTEDCCHPTLGCGSDGCSYYGNIGCGAGQYQTGRSRCCSSYGDQCSACADCPTGRYKGGCSESRSCPGEDAHCPWGHYCPGNGRIHSCAAGTYQPQTGATSADACQSCPAGFAQPSMGRSVCHPCSAGKYAGTGKESCTGTACPAGTFGRIEATSASEAECEGCPVGRWQPTSGQTTCASCPSGWSTAGTTGHSACTACTPGTFASEEGQAQCEQCPAGQRSGTHPAQIRCWECPENSYQPDPGQQRCKECAEHDEKGLPQWVPEDDRTACVSFCDCLRGGRDATGAFVWHPTCNERPDIAHGCATAIDQCTLRL